MFSFSFHLPLLDKTCSIARSIMKKDGEIRLGAMFTALQKDSTKIKYGAYVSKDRFLFRGLTQDEFYALYEATLLHLERTFGALTCHRDFNPRTYTQWGYSRRYVPGDLAGPEHGFSRFRALQSGEHPDAPFFAAGVMPDTIWRVRAEVAKRAA